MVNANRGVQLAHSIMEKVAYSQSELDAQTEKRRQGQRDFYYPANTAVGAIVGGISGAAGALSAQGAPKLVAVPLGAIAGGVVTGGLANLMARINHNVNNAVTPRFVSNYISELELDSADD